MSVTEASQGRLAAYFEAGKGQEFEIANVGDSSGVLTKMSVLEGSRESMRNRVE